MFRLRPQITHPSLCTFGYLCYVCLHLCLPTHRLERLELNSTNERTNPRISGGGAFLWLRDWFCRFP